MRRAFPFLLSFLLLLPLTADAQFGPIVPEVCRTCACGFGGVLAIIQNLVNFIIGLAVIFATIILVWGGILYVLSPTNPESRSTANKMLINAAVGLLIVLSAWLIVDFVMKTLYGGQFGPWHSILLAGEGPSCVESKPNAPLFGGTITSVPGVGGGPSTETGDEAGVRARLAAAGISVNKEACPPGVRYQDHPGGCTSVGGMQEATIQQAIILKGICGSLTVTGGNELGHTEGTVSHTTGYKIDFGTGIDSCIQGGANGYFVRNGSRGSHARYTDKCTNEYVRESDHWDVRVSRACSR